MNSGEVILNYNDLNINLRDVYAGLGYRESNPAEVVIELVNQVVCDLISQVRSHYYFEIFEGKISKDIITIGNVDFNVGKIIVSQLKKSDQFVLFAASAGAELNEYMEVAKQEDDMLRLYIADSLGSIIAECTADKMEQELSKQISSEGYKHTNRFSPGYCGWLVNEQQKLFSFLPPYTCGITLTESSLMLPVKSVSGILGIGRNVSKRGYACDICNYKNCYNRKLKTK